MYRVLHRMTRFATGYSPIACRAHSSSDGTTLSVETWSSTLASDFSWSAEISALARLATLAVKPPNSTKMVSSRVVLGKTQMVSGMQAAYAATVRQYQGTAQRLSSRTN